jgi:hypothetical protein
VPDLPGNFGLLLPFASRGSPGPIGSELGPIVGNDRTVSFGFVDPSSGQQSSLGATQAPQAISTVFDNRQDIPLFKFAIDLSLGEGVTSRSLVATVPLASVTLNRTTWYTQANGLSSYHATQSESNIIPAVIHLVIPSPGSVLALASGGGLLFTRRRRQQPAS